MRPYESPTTLRVSWEGTRMQTLTNKVIPLELELDAGKAHACITRTTCTLILIVQVQVVLALMYYIGSP